MAGVADEVGGRYVLARTHCTAQGRQVLPASRLFILFPISRPSIIGPSLSQTSSTPSAFRALLSAAACPPPPPSHPVPSHFPWALLLSLSSSAPFVSGSLAPAVCFSLFLFFPFPPPRSQLILRGSSSSARSLCRSPPAPPESSSSCFCCCCCRRRHNRAPPLTSVTARLPTTATPSRLPGLVSPPSIRLRFASTAAVRRSSRFPVDQASVPVQNRDQRVRTRRRSVSTAGLFRLPDAPLRW